MKRSFETFRASEVEYAESKPQDVAEGQAEAKDSFAGVVEDSSRLDGFMEVLELLKSAETSSVENVTTRLISFLDSERGDHYVMKFLARLTKANPTAFSALVNVIASNSASTSLRSRATSFLADLIKASPAFADNVLAVALPNSRNKSPHLRLATVKLIAPYMSNQNSKLPLFDTLVVSIQDPDSRVRVTALKTFSEYIDSISEKQAREILPEVVIALRDDVDIVRFEALNLLKLFTERFPTLEIRLISGQQANESITSLKNFAFTKISEMSIDIAMANRIEASRILGSIQNIDTNSMMQTLSKKVLPPSPNVPIQADRGDAMDIDEKGFGENSEPLEIVDRHLAVSQAAGAFVLGLEDEFFQVRAASIESISQLARRSREFALEALPSLVDMFNDEITEIRVKTIECIRKMGDLVTFDPNQLQIVLATLEEANSETREATYSLMSSARLGSAASVLTSINALVNVTLSKYPRDQLRIFECLNQIGLNHSALIAMNAEKLMGVSPMFVTKEQSLANNRYLGVLIAVVSAATRVPELFKTMPPFFDAHFEHLKWRFPSLEIEKPQTPIEPRFNLPPMEGSNSLEKIKIAILSSLKSSKSNPKKLLVELDGHRRDSALLARLERTHLDSCDRIALWLTIVSSLLKMKIEEGDQVASLHQLGQAFASLRGSFAPSVSQIELISEILLAAAIINYSRYIAEHQIFTLFDHDVTASAPLESERKQLEESLFKMLSTSDGTELQWIRPVVESLILPTTSDISLLPLIEFAFSLPARVRITSSLTVTGGTNRIIEFAAPFGGSLPLQISLNQAVPLDNLRILISWPDSTQSLFRLHRPERSGSRSFETTVAFNRPSWSQAAQIAISVVQLTTSPQTSELKKVLVAKNSRLTEGIDYVPLSSSVSVQIHPKPMK